MDSKVAEEVSLPDLFEQFVEATTMRNVLAIHHRLLDHADLSPCEFNTFFPKFKRAITASRQKKNWKAKALFSKIDKRATHKCYSNTKAPTSSSDKPCDTTATTAARSTSQRDGEDNDEDGASADQWADERTFSNNNALKHYNCLVIGSGPAGLRTAIELQLLGASRVVIVEKRGRFSRNNVLHLWPFVIDDLKSLGAKKFYGKFCAGSIDHISIRQLQLMLLKVCLMIGCEFRESCSYIDLCPSSLKAKSQEKEANGNETGGGGDDDDGDNSKCELEQQAHIFVDENKSNNSEPEQIASTTNDGVDLLNETKRASELKKQPCRGLNLRGVRAHFQSDHKPLESELHSVEWDIILGADGRRNTLGGFFPRLEFRGRLAIAITANFINRQTPAETAVPEISGLSFIYNQEMFNTLACDTNIELENICYYKDDTHYFVMTAKKRSLLERGVLLSDYAATRDLLSNDNVDKEALLKYAKDAAFWTTGLEPLDFALNHYGQEDCAMFDFTSMYAASNACRALRTRGGGLAILSLVGDSLLEPFWPTGSGCARGFLSSFDAAWMCRQWAVNKCAVMDNHGASSWTSARSSKHRANNIGGDLGRSQASGELATYDRMAMSVIAERESIYRILAQTTSENLQQNYSHWTLNPHTRYPNLNRHLVSPGQVDHLVVSSGQIRSNLNGGGGGELLSPKTSSSAAAAALATSRRVKSPSTNAGSSRRSPKKLKSAGASPLAQPKNSRNQYKSKPAHKSKSRNDVNIDDFYLEFEQSYRDLDDNEKGATTQYLNYKRRNSMDLDDLFVAPLSGALPSSNNLSKLEARKARDIDECLRQRRQKSKIHLVRDQLISQMRGERNESGAPILSGGNAVLFNEIRRMREQQSRGGGRLDSKPRDATSGPLSLLNSMRRCASFAERVKSFESKLGSNPSGGETPAESVPSTPKTPIDNVKNLPQFATLQELIINNAQTTTKTANDRAGARKSRIPVVAKLSKEDWNVKCWEKRLTVHQQHKQTGLSLSSRSLNKALSMEETRATFNKPKVQLEVFQDRIKQMAGKLESGKENMRHAPLARAPPNSAPIDRRPSGRACHPLAGHQQGGWINHLKRELSKGSENNYRGPNGAGARPMNPALPNKPIKKLFEDEEEEEEDANGTIDVNKHYDHLCLNRPTNKYLAKGSYTSHMARTKYNSANQRVINRQVKPTAESKQAYLAALASRNSSASSTLSDYSSAHTGNSSGSSGGGGGGANFKSTELTRLGDNSTSSIIDVECFRCKRFVSTTERITIGAASLHRACLTCAECGLTLRTNEIQHHLDSARKAKRGGKAQQQQQQQGGNNVALSFLCAICKPDMRADLTREADDRLSAAMVGHHDRKESQQRRLQSREEFLHASINYNELYKNILADEKTGKTSALASPTSRGQKVTPSPTQVTLPLKLVATRSRTATPQWDVDEREQGHERRSASDNESESGRRSSEFSIAESRTVDGLAQVTVILPSDTVKRAGLVEAADQRDLASSSGLAKQHRVSKESDMMDEEELQRILHLNSDKGRKSSDASSSSSSSSSGESGGGGGGGGVEKEESGILDSDRRRRPREGSESASGASSSNCHSDDVSSCVEDADELSSAATPSDYNSSSLEVHSDLE